MIDKHQAIVAKYLMTPNGRYRLRRAMGFHGTREEWIARLSKQLHMYHEMLRKKIRVIK
jgi:hypothetical protein